MEHNPAGDDLVSDPRTFPLPARIFLLRSAPLGMAPLETIPQEARRWSFSGVALKYMGTFSKPFVKFWRNFQRSSSD